jgi:hypothetical protein
VVKLSSTPGRWKDFPELAICLDSEPNVALAAPCPDPELCLWKENGGRSPGADPDGIHSAAT